MDRVSSNLAELLSPDPPDQGAARRPGDPQPAILALYQSATVERPSVRPARAERIDPLASPADPRLVGAFGARRCARLGLLPWRRIGPLTVVLAESPFTVLRHGAELEAALGPVRYAWADPVRQRHALTLAAGDALIHEAETRVAEDLSCRGWQSRRAQLWLGLGVALMLAALLVSPVTALWALFAVTLFTVVQSVAIKATALAVSLRPERRAPAVAAPVPVRPPVVSLLVPLFREEEIAQHLLRRLDRLDYPADRLDICLILEAGDQTTRATIARTALPANAQVVVVPEGTLRTKPRALNYALDFAKGAIIGIYDAEDAPAPDQISKVVQGFAERGPDVACLQGRLDYYNTGLSWMTRCFTLEYAVWFRLILPALARLGLVVPLGGTTLFLRREAIEAVGGWDAHNVTEDADLGLRLARFGYRTELVDSTTFEEANARPLSWVRQRSRWLKGYAMTYAVHMTEPRRLWRELGAWRFLGVQLIFLGTLLQLALAPVLWTFWGFSLGFGHPVADALGAPALLALLALFILAEALSVGAAFAASRASGRRWLWLWAPTMIAYYPLATIAFYVALFELLTRPFLWHKTPHGAFGGAEVGPGETDATALPAPSAHQA